MKAIILAAGRGNRMHGLTDDRPKCLVKVGGRTLLDRQLTALRGAGISDVAIVTGYRREALSGFGLTEFYNERWESTNMVSSLESAGAWLSETPVVVSYSDIFYDSDAVTLLMGAEVDLAVTYDPNWLSIWSRRFENPLDDAETFRLGSDGYLEEIGGRPKSLDEIQGQYMGLLRISPFAWQKILELRDGMPLAERNRMHMTGTLRRLLEGAVLPIKGLAYPGRWGEVDSESDLDAYRNIDTDGDEPSK